MNFLKYLPNFFKMENYVYGENIIISQFTVVLITISYKIWYKYRFLYASLI